MRQTARPSAPIAGSARVRSEARSEPVSGSVNDAVGMILPLIRPGSRSVCCAGVPLSRISSQAISVRVPSDPRPIQLRDSSSVTTHIAVLPSPDPPHDSGTVSPKTPSSPSSAMTASGISSLRRCHPWAASAWSSDQRANCARISSSELSSKPASPNERVARPSAISVAIRARTGGAKPSARSDLTAATAVNCAIASPVWSIRSGRKISP